MRGDWKNDFNLPPLVYFQQQDGIVLAVLEPPMAPWRRLQSADDILRQSAKFLIDLTVAQIEWQQEIVFSDIAYLTFGSHQVFRQSFLPALQLWMVDHSAHITSFANTTRRERQTIQVARQLIEDLTRPIAPPFKSSMGPFY